MRSKDLKFTVESHNEKISISNFDLQNIYELVSWSNIPFFPVPGRVAWYLLKHPVCKNNTTYYGVKLKGIGIWNPSNFNNYNGVHSTRFFEMPHQPLETGYNYTSETKHIGFNNLGELISILGEPAPLGGITLNKATNEFNNCLKLWESSVPVTVPLLVCSYNELHFLNQQMAVVGSLMPTKSPFRLNLFMNSYNNLPQDQLKFIIEISEKITKSSLQFNQFDVLPNILCLYGTVLKKFSLSGFFRHSGGLDNLCFDDLNCSVVLTDVDSSIALSTIPAKIRSLQVLRDCVSVLYKYLQRIFHPCSHALDVPFEKKIYPLYSFLKAYFADADDCQLNKFFAILKIYSQPLYEYSQKSQKSIQNQYDRIDFFLTKRGVFFSFCLLFLSDIFNSSEFSIIYGFINKDCLLENIKNFLDSDYFIVEKLIEAFYNTPQI